MGGMAQRCGPGGAMGGGPPALPQYVAGMSAPQYGMPMCGTPIGLPGPPHVPLGIPAGLRRHSIRNSTPVHMPKPNHAVKVHVRQQPGYSYPKPPSHMSIREQNIHPSLPFMQPFSDMHQRADRQSINCQPTGCPQY